ncbi:MAG: tRNA-dihydrouridine synthase [Phycisphaerae bacterium]
MLQIGKINLDVPFFQASLSGYSDRPMRVLAKEHGAPLTFAGVMLSTIIRHPRVLKHPNFAVKDDEHPIGAQILGNDPETMVAAAKGLVGIGYDLIDLNFACPAPKVLRRQRGGFMLNNPDLVLEIYQLVREAVQCPVLMKLRIGYDDSKESLENFWEITERAAGEGIDALIIHGRVVKQKYRGKADWEILTEVKRRFPNTTIIGSGDIFTAESVVRRLAGSGIDAVTIARGAVGNPWIFTETKALLEGRPKPPPPSLREQGETVLRHFLMVLDQYKRRKGIAYFRKFSVGYCKRHPLRRKAQMALMAGKDEATVVEAIREWYRIM